jgi:pimeloyl-ACP methyl ester carboxylesterase
MIRPQWTNMLGKETKVRRWISFCVAATLTAGISVPGSASASQPPTREEYFTLPGAVGPGPASDNQIHVLRAGSPSASQVLVLVSGQFGAAGDFRLLARELAARVPSTQVWAVDRREQNLADLSGFQRALQRGEGRQDPDRAAAYYLGDHYRRQTAQTAPYVAGWGLSLTLADLRQVVRSASEGGRRRVVLGGHSWGAATVLAYAAWDFNGRPGYRDLSGLVLIDGGVHDAFAGEGDVYRLSAQDAADGLARIAAGEVFDPALTMGRTETFPILQQLIGEYAKAAPDAPSALASYLPAALRPPMPVTNLGLVDWLFVTHPLVPDASVNPAYTRLPVLADVMAGPVPSVFEWYWPQRLTLDLEATDAYAQTPTADLLGLRLWHTRDIDVPLYSFQTGLTHGTVNTAARWVVANSKIPTASYDGDAAMTHLDVLWADAPSNTMLRSLAPFLRQLDRR